MAPRLRLQGYVAAAAPCAVLLRRAGPNLWSMIRWDLATDCFEEGEWLQAKIHVERCDISPDGAFFVWCMSRHWAWSTHSGRTVCTAVSRPPFFAPLAIVWHSSGSREGGGEFLPEPLAASPEWSVAENFGPPPNLARRTWRDPRSVADEAACRRRLHGWAPLCDESTAFIKPNHSGACLIARDSAKGWFKRHGIRDAFALKSAGRAELALETVDWADFDHRGDLLFSRHAELFRLRAQDCSAGIGDWPTLLAQATLLADFTDRQFEHVDAPYNSVDMESAMIV